MAGKFHLEVFLSPESMLRANVRLHVVHKQTLPTRKQDRAIGDLTRPDAVAETRLRRMVQTPRPAFHIESD